MKTYFGGNKSNKNGLFGQNIVKVKRILGKYPTRKNWQIIKISFFVTIWQFAVVESQTRVVYDTNTTFTIWFIA